MSSLISKLLTSIFVVALVSCDSTDAFYVDAGLDQTVQSGAVVSLIGTADSPDGTITSYRWEQISGEAVVLIGNTTSSTGFTAPIVTSDITLTFRLIVNDTRGGSVTDDVNVFVTVLPPVVPSIALSVGNVEIESNDTLLTADALIIGDSVTGQVANSTDKDWFGFSATAGADYQIQFEGTKDIANYSSAYWVINVYDSFNNLLVSTPVDGSLASPSASLNVGIGITGTHYVVVESLYSSISNIPTQFYTVTVNKH